MLKSQQGNENTFLLLHIPSDKGAGNRVDSREGAFTGKDAVGDSTGRLCAFTGDTVGG
jgi:hypothetical protein